jgi:hypothetical protein
MMIVASNESIFEAMARRTTGSDAGMVRTFEIEMTEAPNSTKSPAEITLLFESLGQNYGHAGRIYAQYLATHAQEVVKAVQDTFLKLTGDNMGPAERFWFGIMAILLVGASVARKLDLADINLRSLHEFLMDNLDRLRGRTHTTTEENSLDEILANYLRDRGNSTLYLDELPKFHGRPPVGYLPEIKGSPKSGAAAVVVGITEKKARFSTRDFTDWLREKEIPFYGMVEQIEEKFATKRRRTTLGAGTSYAGPRVYTLDIDLNEADFSSPDGIPDSSTSTSPAS